MDKLAKVRDEIEKLKSQLLRGACSSQIAMETMCKEEAYNEVLAILDTMQEEPVSEELEKAAEQDVCEVVNCCSATGIPNDHIPSWVQDAMINEFIHGAEWRFERAKEALLSEVLPCFMHGGEADEVVAKLDEVLNQKKQEG